MKVYAGRFPNNIVVVATPTSSDDVGFGQGVC